MTISVYLVQADWVPFSLYMELTLAPLMAGTDNNINPVLLQVKIAYIPTAICDPRNKPTGNTTPGINKKIIHRPIEKSVWILSTVNLPSGLFTSVGSYY